MKKIILLFILLFPLFLFSQRVVTGDLKIDLQYAIQHNDYSHPAFMYYNRVRAGTIDSTIFTYREILQTQYGLRAKIDYDKLSFPKSYYPTRTYFLYPEQSSYYILFINY